MNSLLPGAAMSNWPATVSVDARAGTTTGISAADRAATIAALINPATKPNDLVRPAAWWAERQAIARRVLAAGNAELAYRLIEQHGLIEGNAFSEAQFLLGYIALRYRKDPTVAFDHFARPPVAG